MLFVVSARHTAEMCPAGVVHPDKQLGSKIEKAANQAGAKLVEVYLDAPGHAFFLILEVTTNAQLWDATEPLRIIGDVQFSPVMRLGEALKHARKLGIQK